MSHCMEAKTLSDIDFLKKNLFSSGSFTTYTIFLFPSKPIEPGLSMVFIENDYLFRRHVPQAMAHIYQQESEQKQTKNMCEDGL